MHHKSPPTRHTSYAPLIPSPLNPYTTTTTNTSAESTTPPAPPPKDSPARTHRRTSSIHSAPSKPVVKPARRPASLSSPTQRLLRQKAQEAWRSETLRHHVLHIQSAAADGQHTVSPYTFTFTFTDPPFSNDVTEKSATKPSSWRRRRDSNTWQDDDLLLLLPTREEAEQQAHQPYTDLDLLLNEKGGVIEDEDDDDDGDLGLMMKGVVRSSSTTKGSIITTTTTTLTTTTTEVPPPPPPKPSVLMGGQNIFDIDVEMAQPTRHLNHHRQFHRYRPLPATPPPPSPPPKTGLASVARGGRRKRYLLPAAINARHVLVGLLVLLGLAVGHAVWRVWHAGVLGGWSEGVLLV